MFKQYEKEYLDGTPAISIIKKYGLPQDSFYKYLSDVGIKRSMREAHSVYNINQDVFEKVNSEQGAYFLGLLFADGTLSVKKQSVRLKLSYKDLEIIESFKLFLQYDGPIKKREYSKKNKNWQDQVGIDIYNKKLNDDLFILGMVPAKSLILKMPNIPKEYLKDFIRGYYDGDGGIYIYKNKKRFNIQFTSSSEFIESLSKIFKNKFGFAGTITSRHNNNCKTMMIGGEQQIIRLLDWLYSDATIFINRKHQQYLEAKEIQSKKRKYNYVPNIKSNCG